MFKIFTIFIIFKTRVGDKIKLICGNHDLMNYKRFIIPEYSCCGDIKDIKHLITLIVFKAISKGQIRYLDKLKIGTTN